MKDESTTRVFTVPLRKRKGVETEFICCFVSGTIEAGNTKVKLTATEGEQTYSTKCTVGAIFPLKR